MIHWSSIIILCAWNLVTAIGLAQSAKKAENVTKSLPAEFFLAKQPEGAKTVEETKASAKTGERVLIRGRIGGSKTPFVEGRAVFTLMGSGLKACADNPEDKCKTPWDYCCETPESITKHSVMIQVVDAAGNPLRIDLKGTNGLKELSEVVIDGKVKQATDKILIVNATALFIVQR